MFVVLFKQHGALNCEAQVFGPFADYQSAEDALESGAVPLLYGQGGCPWPSLETEAHRGVMEFGANGYRFIQPLEACEGSVR